MELDELTLSFGNALLEQGMQDVELLQVEQKTKLSKRIVVCTAQNNMEAKKVAEAIKQKFADVAQCFHTDGIFKGDWVVLDYDDVIVHIFTNETRQKFSLEKLYKDAKNCVCLNPEDVKNS